MMKIILLLVFVSFNLFAGLTLRGEELNELTNEIKAEISNLALRHKNEIDENRVKFGIISDLKNETTAGIVDLIKSYITDSLSLNPDVILEKFFPWTPSLQMPLNDVRPSIIEVIPVTNFFQTSLIMLVDSANAQVRGDTISTDNDGFALIRFNNNHRITLHENTKIVLSHSQVRLLAGNISVSQSGQLFTNHFMLPLRIVSDKGIFDLNGNALVSVGEFSVAQIFGGQVISRTETAVDTTIAGNAVSLSDETKVFKPLPCAPVLFEEYRFAALPGDSINFKNTGDFKQRIIVANAENKKIIDKIAYTDCFNLLLQFGALQYFAQNIDTAGIVSPWTQKNISVRRLDGLKSLEIFDDTLYFVTDDRPFIYRGVANTSIKLFIDNEMVEIASDGRFSHKVMLKDSMNYPEIIVKYKDFSGDTIFPTIFYTGYDERITMNDSLLNKPAFTTSRIYKWRGVAPTATQIRINNEIVEIKEGGEFEKVINVREYRIYPVIIDVIYENENSKTFTRTLSREKYTSSKEVGLREGLLSVIATMLVGTIVLFSATGHMGD